MVNRKIIERDMKELDEKEAARQRAVWEVMTFGLLDENSQVKRSDLGKNRRVLGEARKALIESGLLSS